jgi:hypothetical protein
VIMHVVSNQMLWLWVSQSNLDPRQVQVILLHLHHII